MGNEAPASDGAAAADESAADSAAETPVEEDPK